ncbi:MAG TPA: signal peptidase I [Gammaproteobacteria bacterium]|nr:signal peptidase I [Gammaproteobacteria bacterium]
MLHIILPYVAATSFATSCWGFMKCSHERKDPNWLMQIHRVTVFSTCLTIITYAGVELFLTTFTLFLLVVATLDRTLLEKTRHRHQQEPTEIVDFARSFIWIVLVIWIIRSFVIQPYRVPTGSLEPTVMPGDFLAVNQYIYGLRLPVLHKKLLKVSHPKRGDIVVFRPPHDPYQIFVKRVIGLPGETITYKDKKIFIDGKLVPQEFIGTDIDRYNLPTPLPVIRVSEKLNGKNHDIFLNPYEDHYPNLTTKIPEGHYFMMGDNRDNSGDSRAWGTVPEKDLIGKAVMVIMNWDAFHWTIHWNRIGLRL